MKNKIRRERQRGNAVLEFALILIPMVLIVFTSIDLSRYMWQYQTLASAVKRGVRYAIVHGDECVASSPQCAATIGSVSQVISKAAIGLDTDSLALDFTAGNATASCSSVSECISTPTMWPPANANLVGTRIAIAGRYSFRPVVFSWVAPWTTSLAMSAQSTQTIQF